MKKYTKGFTLIELLVVIAIIGILASVVLVSLNSARQKAKDSRVMSDVQQIRTALESGYNGAAYPDYTVPSGATSGTLTISSTGPQNSTISQLTTDATNQGGAIYLYGAGAASNGGNPTSYVIFGKLTASNSWFCIDSTGKTNASYAPTTSTLSPAYAAYYVSTCP